MTKERAEELITAIVCEGENKDYVRIRDFKVTATIDKNENKIDVAVEQMYQFVDTSFKRLKQISEAFGTDEIDINSWHSNGCETCDYGSCYNVTFNIINPTKE